MDNIINKPIIVEIGHNANSLSFEMFIMEAENTLSQSAKRQIVASNIKQILKQHYTIRNFEIIREHSKYLIHCQDEENISVCVSYSANFISISFLKSAHEIFHTHDIEVVKDGFMGIMKRFNKNEFEYISAKDTKERFFEVWTKKEALAKLYHSSIEHMLKHDSLNTNTPIVTKKINVFDNILIVSFACRNTQIYPLN